MINFSFGTTIIYFKYFVIIVIEECIFIINSFHVDFKFTFFNLSNYLLCEIINYHFKLRNYCFKHHFYVGYYSGTHSKINLHLKRLDS